MFVMTQFCELRQSDAICLSENQGSSISFSFFIFSFYLRRLVDSVSVETLAITVSRLALVLLIHD